MRTRGPALPDVMRHVLRCCSRAGLLTLLLASCTGVFGPIIRPTPPAPPPDRPGGPPPSGEPGREPPRLTSPEARIVALVNRERQRHGLAALLVDERLTDEARRHSDDMVRHGFFGHSSPSRGNLRQRLQAAGIAARAWAENVARASTADEVHNGLIRSPSHRENILSPDYTHIGVGAVSAGARGDLMVTQIFAALVR